MGRGSDTRMYNPRSESSHMFRENHEEEGTRTGYEDPRDLDNRADKRQAKKEKEEKEEKKIKHIKVRRHHLRSGQDEMDEEESPMEDSEYKPRGSVDNPSKQTIPSGAGGFLTSLATQAKGPGAAAGQLVAMSEPMLDAWSELLKQEGPDVTDEYDYYNYYDTYADEDRPLAHMPHSTLDARLAERGEAGEYAHDNDDEFDELIHEYLMRDRENRSGVDRGGFSQEFQDIHTSEPMENAWSELLKSKPKGLPQGVPHASDTGKSKRERDRDTQSDIARRKRNPVKVMRNPVQSALTTGQHNRMKTALELLEQYGSADRIPPKILAQRLPEFLRTTATRERKPSVGRKPFEGERIYGGEGIKQRDAQKYIRPLTPTQRKTITGGEYHDSLLDALNTGQFMSELSTFAENAPAYDRRLEEARRVPLPPEPTPEPQPVQEDKIEPGLYPGTFFVNGDFMDARQFAAYQAQKNQQQKSEPIEHAWSELLKSKKEERKRKKEEGAKFRPSTGAFERPRGGFGGRPATPARAKIISRNLPVGRHTGLNLADLAVEMSHRGVASKQPMSKDPQQYRDYMATQEAQKRVGNVRTPYAEHRRFGRPSRRAKSGMPRVPRPRLHPVRAPSIVPPKMKMPRLRKPKMPGMVTMSEDEVTQSDVLKSASDAGYLRILVRELREALRETRDKDRKRKGMGTPDTSGAASNLPNHPSNSHAQTSTPQGGTENEEAEAKMYGADPAQVINARGSNKS